MSKIIIDYDSDTLPSQHQKLLDMFLHAFKRDEMLNLIR